MGTGRKSKNGTGILLANLSNIPIQLQLAILAILPFCRKLNLSQRKFQRNQPPKRNSPTLHSPFQKQFHQGKVTAVQVRFHLKSVKFKVYGKTVYALYQYFFEHVSSVLEVRKWAV
jgi:hypothetical protein